MTVTKTKTPNEYIVFFVGGISKLQLSFEREKNMASPSLESTSIAFMCMINLKPTPQAETPRQVNKSFSQEDWGCFFNLLFLLCHTDSNLPRTVSLIVIVPWDSGMQVSWPLEPHNLEESLVWSVHAYWF